MAGAAATDASLPPSSGWLCPSGHGGEVVPDRRIARESRPEVSNPVLLVTKEVFCPSNSGGDGEGENRGGEGSLSLCH